jgi:hypothetical protein
MQLESPPDQPLWVVSVPNMLLNLREAAELEELGIHPTAPGGVRLVNGDALHWQRGSKTLRSDSRPWMNPDSCVFASFSRQIYSHPKSSEHGASILRCAKRSG